MPNLTLFVSPHTCARVATVALEEIGVPFDTVLIRTSANEQNSPEYLKVNPKGKVPALLIDGAPLTENVAILTWLATEYPEAKLLPKVSGKLEKLRQTADISFFSGTVHPVVTRIAMPMKFIPDAAQSFQIVRPKATEDMQKFMKLIEGRLDNGPWWYGDTWSILDAYLFWVWSRITGVGFDGSAFPNILRHHELCAQRPAVQRAMAREEVNIEVLKSEGLYAAPK